MCLFLLLSHPFRTLFLVTMVSLHRGEDSMGRRVGKGGKGMMKVTEGEKEKKRKRLRPFFSLHFSFFSS